MAIFDAAGYAAFDGVTDDTAGLQRLGADVAAAGAGDIVLPANKPSLIYASGQAINGNPLFNWNNGKMKSVRIFGNGATLNIGHTFATTELLNLVNLIQDMNFYIEGLNVVQVNPVSFPVGSPYGTVLLSGANNSGDPTKDDFNMRVTQCSITGGQTLVEMSNSTNILIENCVASNCWYGVLGLDGAKNLTATNFFSRGNYRDIFLKGVTGFDIGLVSVNPVSNAVLLSADAPGVVLGGGKIRYRVLRRTAAASAPTTYVYLGTGSVAQPAGTIYRKIDLDLDIDASGDSAIAPAFQIAKGTTAPCGAIYQGITISGAVSGVPNAAGNVVDLFTAPDASWAGETANNIAFENFTVTGSDTPNFYVDQAPLAGAGLSLTNVSFPGDYVEVNSPPIRRHAFNASFKNKSYRTREWLS